MTLSSELPLNSPVLLFSRLLCCPLYQHVSSLLLYDTQVLVGTAVEQWLRCCVINRKVAGSIPDGVIGIFH